MIKQNLSDKQSRRKLSEFQMLSSEIKYETILEMASFAA